MICCSRYVEYSRLNKDRMKNFVCRLVQLAVVGLIVLAIASEPVLSDNSVAKRATTATELSKSAASKFQLPKIFNFEMYKRLFHRVYKGVEETVRRKLMLARALRVWISSIKYKYGRIAYYFSLNQFSDRTPEELSRMQNRKISGKRENIIQNNETQRQSSDIPDIDTEHIEEELDRLTDVESGLIGRVEGLREQLDDEPKKSQIPPIRRRKRDVLDKGVRDVELDQMKWFLREGNQTSTHWSHANKTHLRVRPWFEGSGGQSKELPDEVFLDHSDSKCMFLPRDQRFCGSCYAFTATAIAEWLHCNLTGQLVAFSEQYMIDCGKATGVTNGCYGGSAIDTVNFINNYGLELAAHYPYRSKEGQCPYDRNTKPKSMGYIRMDFNSSLEIHLDTFEDFLPYGPIYNTLSTNKQTFFEYGGGVMDGEGCDLDAMHAMVLVGHGREHGREYWLYRNSYGVGWGELGYYKLAKDSDCIHPKYGVLYGTEDGLKRLVKPEKNHAYNSRPLKSHYSRQMSDDLLLGRF